MKRAAQPLNMCSRCHVYQTPEELRLVYVYRPAACRISSVYPNIPTSLQYIVCQTSMSVFIKQ